MKTNQKKRRIKKQHATKISIVSASPSPITQSIISSTTSSLNSASTYPPFIKKSVLKESITSEQILPSDEAVLSHSGEYYSSFKTYFSNYLNDLKNNEIEVETDEINNQNQNIITSSLGSAFVAGWGWNASSRAGRRSDQGQSGLMEIKKRTSAPSSSNSKSMTVEEQALKSGTIPLPTQVQASSHLPIVAAAAGGNHSLLLTNSGVTYSFGSNRNDELGYGSAWTDQLEKEPEYFHRTEQAIPRQVNPTGLSTKTALIDSTEVETDVRIAQVESGRGFSISREMTVEESALLVEGLLSSERSLTIQRSLFSESIGLAMAFAVVKAELASLGKNSKGRILSWGKGPAGELGLVPYPNLRGPLGAEKPAYDLSVTSNSSSDLMMKRKHAYKLALGDTLPKGLRAKIDPSYLHSPKPYPLPYFFSNNISICMIATGLHHTLAITKDGDCYTWGRGAYGVLGHGDFFDRHSPCLLKGLGEGPSKIKVKMVAAGQDHSAIIVEMAPNSGLFIDKKRRSTAPINSSLISTNSLSSIDDSSSIASFSTFSQNSQSNLGYGIRLEKEKSLAINGSIIEENDEDLREEEEDNSIIILNQNEDDESDYFTRSKQVQQKVMCFGRGAHGRLGNGSNRNTPIPVLVEKWPLLPSFSRPYKRDKNDLYKWNNSTDNMDQYEEEFIDPNLFDIGDIEIKSISCGGAHTVCLLTRKVPKSLVFPYGVQTYVLAWGQGIKGQLGNGYLEDRFTPQLVKFDKSEVVVQVSCGRSYTLALTIHGKVYSWGVGTRGQLGYGVSSELMKFDTVMNQVDLVSKESANIAFSNSISSSLILMTEKNEEKDLRMEYIDKVDYFNSLNYNMSIIPKEVSMPGGAIQVKAGQWHALALYLPKRILNPDIVHYILPILLYGKSEEKNRLKKSIIWNLKERTPSILNGVISKRIKNNDLPSPLDILLGSFVIDTNKKYLKYKHHHHYSKSNKKKTYKGPGPVVLCLSRSRIQIKERMKDIALFGSKSVYSLDFHESNPSNPSTHYFSKSIIPSNQKIVSTLYNKHNVMNFMDDSTATNSYFFDRIKTFTPWQSWLSNYSYIRGLDKPKTLFEVLPPSITAPLPISPQASSLPMVPVRGWSCVGYQCCKKQLPSHPYSIPIHTLLLRFVCDTCEVEKICLQCATYCHRGHKIWMLPLPQFDLIPEIFNKKNVDKKENEPEKKKLTSLLSISKLNISVDEARSRLNLPPTNFEDISVWKEYRTLVENRLLLQKYNLNLPPIPWQGTFSFPLPYKCSRKGDLETFPHNYWMSFPIIDDNKVKEEDHELIDDKKNSSKEKDLKESKKSHKVYSDLSVYSIPQYPKLQLRPLFGVLLFYAKKKEMLEKKAREAEIMARRRKNKKLSNDTSTHSTSIIVNTNLNPEEESMLHLIRSFNYPSLLLPPQNLLISNKKINVSNLLQTLKRTYQIDACHCSLFHSKCQLLPDIPESLANETDPSPPNSSPFKVLSPKRKASEIVSTSPTSPKMLSNQAQMKKAAKVLGFQVEPPTPTKINPKLNKLLGIDPASMPMFKVKEEKEEPEEEPEDLQVIRARKKLEEREKLRLYDIEKKKDQINFEKQFIHLLLPWQAKIKVFALKKRKKITKKHPDHAVIRRAVCTWYVEEKILVPIYEKIMKEVELNKEYDERIRMEYEEKQTRFFLGFKWAQQQQMGFKAMSYGLQWLIGRASIMCPLFTPPENEVREEFISNSRKSSSALVKYNQEISSRRSSTNNLVDQISISRRSSASTSIRQGEDLSSYLSRKNSTNIVIPKNARPGTSQSNHSENLYSESEDEDDLSSIYSINIKKSKLNTSRPPSSTIKGIRERQFSDDESDYTGRPSTSNSIRGNTNSYPRVNILPLAFYPSFAFTYESLRFQQLHLHPRDRLHEKVLCRIARNFPINSARKRVWPMVKNFNGAFMNSNLTEKERILKELEDKKNNVQPLSSSDYPTHLPVLTPILHPKSFVIAHPHSVLPGIETIKTNQVKKTNSLISQITSKPQKDNTLPEVVNKVLPPRTEPDPTYEVSIPDKDLILWIQKYLHGSQQDQAILTSYLYNTSINKVEKHKENVELIKLKKRQQILINKNRMLRNATTKKTAEQEEKENEREDTITYEEIEFNEEMRREKDINNYLKELFFYTSSLPHIRSKYFPPLPIILPSSEKNSLLMNPNLDPTLPPALVALIQRKNVNLKKNASYFKFSQKNPLFVKYINTQMLAAFANNSNQTSTDVSIMSNSKKDKRKSISNVKQQPQINYNSILNNNFNPFENVYIPPFKFRRHSISDPCNAFKRILAVPSLLRQSCITKRRDSLPLYYLQTGEKTIYTPPVAKEKTKDAKGSTKPKEIIKKEKDEDSHNKALVNMIKKNQNVDFSLPPTLNNLRLTYIPRLDNLIQIKTSINFFTDRKFYLDALLKEFKDYKRLNKADQNMKWKYMHSKVRKFFQGAINSPTLPYEITSFIRNPYRRRSICSTERFQSHINTVLDLKVANLDMEILSTEIFGFRRRRRSFDYSELKELQYGIVEELGLSDDQLNIPDLISTYLPPTKTPPEKITITQLKTDSENLDYKMAMAGLVEGMTPELLREKLKKKKMQKEWEERLGKLGVVTSITSQFAELQNEKKKEKEREKEKEKEAEMLSTSNTSRINTATSDGLISSRTSRRNSNRKNSKLSTSLSGIFPSVEQEDSSMEPSNNSSLIIWQEYYTEDGYPYYYDPISGNSVWEFPTGPQDQVESLYTTDEGYSYYYNHTTQESRWA